MNPIKGKRQVVALTDLPSNDRLAGPAPTPDLLKSLREDGMVIPVLLMTMVAGYAVIDGGRRIKAARQLDWDRIEAIVREPLDNEAFLKARNVANFRRSINLIAVLHAARDLAKSMSSPEDIAEALGLTVQIVKQALRLGCVPDAILKAAEDGVIRMGTLKAVAGLGTADLMRQALTLLEEEGGLTIQQVHALKRVGVKSAAAAIALPGLAQAPPPSTVQYAVLAATGQFLPQPFVSLLDADGSAHQTGGTVFRLVAI
jgi:ParB/RepB/Spo0J family partition protein